MLLCYSPSSDIVADDDDDEEEEEEAEIDDDNSSCLALPAILVSAYAAAALFSSSPSSTFMSIFISSENGQIKLCADDPGTGTGAIIRSGDAVMIVAWLSV